MYIPNFRTFRHFIKKLYSFLFLLKKYCFLYTGLSYYSDDMLNASYLPFPWSIGWIEDEEVLK